MELTNEFRVDRPIDETWNVLTDVERIAPALPGAQLQEIEGDEYRGIVKVKVGPITAQYKGKATFVEKDDTNHKAVLKAEGRDTKGQGNASALITATLVPDAQGTKVTVHTDLTVTGKVAQFGRGIMADVSTKLLNQFVEQLETTILAGTPARRRSPRPLRLRSPTRRWRWQRQNRKRRHRRRTRRRRRRSVGSTIRSPSRSTSSDSAGASVAKRVVPVVIGGLLILLFVRGVRRRHRG